MLSLADEPFEILVQKVEAQSTYHFYYDTTQVQGLRITIQVVGQPLPSVLKAVLKDSKLYFAIDEQHNVFITKGTPVYTQLPGEQSATSVTTHILPVKKSERLISDPDHFSALERRLYEIGNGNRQLSEKSTISGYVRLATSGEPIVGAAVYVEPSGLSTATDAEGRYSLTLPSTRYELWVKGIGLRSTKRQILLRADGRLDIVVDNNNTTLQEVIIQGQHNKNVTSTQMGIEQLDIKTIRQVPTALGEADVLRVLLTLPGVKSVGEGSTGLNVRGGGTDQNLILFNSATIYNPSHLFGFFSAFNPDIVDKVELYKAAIPAQFGGRLSSVLDITSRDGNTEKLHGTGGIGLLTSRLALEGPIVNKKNTFLVGGRTTYSDWLLKQLPSKEFNRSAAAFYDGNVQLKHIFNNHNTLTGSAYISRDRFRLASDTVYRYTNQAASLKWQHVVNERLAGNITGTYSRYYYDITNQNNPAVASALSYSLLQASVQADASYLLSDKHTIEFGAGSTLYNIEPGSLKPLGNESLIAGTTLAHEKALESALYVSDKITIGPRLLATVGLRYSFFNALGPRNVYRYLSGAARSESTIIDTVAYGASQVLATYHGPEYRVAARYAFNDNSSVKLSYNRTRQYIHMLSNTTVMSPTDVWKLSDANVRPQVGDQAAIGYYRDAKQHTIETSVEIYYKKLHDVVDYKSGALLLLNSHIETDIINAQGRAYGVEFLVRKLTGKINGWLSYTYSRSLIRTKGLSSDEIINQGKYYPSNFDKPHDVSLVGNYRFNKRFSTSLNFVYNTGRPITLPLAKYYVNNTVRVYYSERNAYRVPDYYRFDIALNIEGNHKITKFSHSSWNIGIYNLTGRKNPYSIYFKSVDGVVKGYKLSIFGRPIPTVTYNFKF
ncbi:TonB-dependent receptor [Hymenobacter citatus]|nr:TonB-dependent receptor [Hymenobacter citatus]